MRKDRNQLPLWQRQRLDNIGRAQLMKERFPSVNRISIEIHEKPEEELGGGPRTVPRSYRSDDRAYFHFPCRYENSDNCSRGGLDLEGEIIELVRNRQSTISKSTHCEGKHGGETRPGNSRCMLPIEYSIIVEYSSFAD
jgi:hypothetical protein